MNDLAFLTERLAPQKVRMGRPRRRWGLVFSLLLVGLTGGEHTGVLARDAAASEDLAMESTVIPEVEFGKSKPKPKPQPYPKGAPKAKPAPAKKGANAPAKAP